MYGRGTEMPYMCYTILIFFFFSSSFLPFFDLLFGNIFLTTFIASTRVYR